jgi:glycosyltransferase involved in cell wall biosynthesis
MDRIVVGTTGGADLPHMKYRLGPLAREGTWPLEVIAAGTFPEPHDVEQLVQAGGDDAVLVLQRVLPERADLERLRSAYGAVVFDFDDALYEAMPDLRGSALRRGAKQALRLAARGSTTASSRRRPLVRVLREVDVAVAGNEVLARFARRYARRVVEIPSTVEPVAAPPPRSSGPPALVWTGVAGNRQYLELLRVPLARLAKDHDFRMRVVCSQSWEDPPVPVEFVPWSPEAEREALLTSVVGLAPLSDDPFSRGKCQYRSIVFGGHGLATVATPVGVMGTIIVHGETGFLARSEDEWFTALRRCITEPGLAEQLGARALERIRARYSHEIGISLWKQLFTELSSEGSAQPAAGEDTRRTLPARTQP